MSQAGWSSEPASRVLGVSAGPGLRAVVHLEGGAPYTPVPPAPDVGRLPGARMEGFTVATAGSSRVQLGCARAPSARWVPGLEGVVLERAMSLALQPWAVRPAQLVRAEAPAVPGATASSRWTGATDQGERLAVAHVLAFAGEDADAVACSVLCLEPALPLEHPREHPQHPPEQLRCDAVAASLAFEGDLRSAPPPGPLARAVLWSAEHPVGAACWLGAAGVAVVCVLFARRPGRPTASRRARAAPR